MLVVGFKRKEAWYISKLIHAKSLLKPRFKLNLSSELQISLEFRCRVVSLAEILVLNCRSRQNLASEWWLSVFSGVLRCLVVVVGVVMSGGGSWWLLSVADGGQ